MRSALAVLAAVLILAGCQTETRTASRYTGTLGGAPVDVVEVGAASATSGIDMAAAVAAAVAAVRGDVADLAAALKAVPPPAPPIPPADLAAAVWQAAPPPAAAPPAPGDPWAPIGYGLAGLAAATVPAVLKAREAARQRADADEAWRLLLAAKGTP
jgi:hypothetical protein